MVNQDDANSPVSTVSTQDVPVPEATSPETVSGQNDAINTSNEEADCSTEPRADHDLPQTNADSFLSDDPIDTVCETEDGDAAAAAAIADFDAEVDTEETGEDDIVNVIIKPSNKGGIYKTGTTYQARSVAHTTQHTKATRQGVELDDPGDIHGVPTLEFNLSTLGDEDKPWKQPGADITDYFNYGFTEETWVLYCEKQKILRQEYANSTLKPVLSTGGTGMLQRLRSSGGASTGIRSYDNPKATCINVINLSNSTGNRAASSGLHGQSKNTSETASLLLNGSANNSSSLLSTFAQPPPGYLTNNPQSDNNPSFSMPPPGYSALGANGASQILANAGAASLFPNVALPPPILGGLSNWAGVLGGADAVIDPLTGQISSILEHGGQSPESTYSNEDRGSRRRSRHRHMEDTDHFERDAYRPRKRSRSDSRERRHSRHRSRHHESGHSNREYESRHSSRRAHRSPRDRRGYPGDRLDEPMDPIVFSAPTSAIMHRSDRAPSRSDRVSTSGRERSYHRSREVIVGSSSSSSRREPSYKSSRHRSGHRRDSPSPSPPRVSIRRESSRSSRDPLAAAAAAAASIAMTIGSSGGKGSSGGS